MNLLEQRRRDSSKLWEAGEQMEEWRLPGGKLVPQGPAGRMSTGGREAAAPPDPGMAQTPGWGWRPGMMMVGVRFRRG